MTILSIVVVPVRVAVADSTVFPEPVELVTPVPPLATDNVPVVPAMIGSPVQEVRVPDDGVPSTGVTRVGEVAFTILPDPVLAVDITCLLPFNSNTVDAVRFVKVTVPSSAAVLAAVKAALACNEPLAVIKPEAVIAAMPIVPVSVGEFALTTAFVPVMAADTNCLLAFTCSISLAVTELNIGADGKVTLPVVAIDIALLPLDHRETG